MIEIQDVHKKLLKEYPRAIVHMRAQLKVKRFSLVFGAGLNVTFGLPDWGKLIEEIAADPNVDGHKILKRFSGRGSLPYKTELLFQHFRTKQAVVAGTMTLGSQEFENQTLSKWFDICAKYLYINAPSDFEKALDNHAYLLKYLPIIQETPITITYNFDDYIEQALWMKRGDRDPSLGYETVTNPWTQFRRQNAVIYHPHGVLPKEQMEFPQDRLVFSESSYARLFLGALAGDFSFILNHMSKNTCLILGSSLEDEDLRNVLVQSAQSNPGNPHYYIYYLKAGETVAPPDKEAIKWANFHVYNLITLFLNEAEIAALAELLYCGGLDDNHFVDLSLEVDKCAVYRFYLTGALGVGKSSTVNQLRNLMVLDEWAEPRLPLLAKPWDTLTHSERDKCDSWIAKQFKIKNDKLRHEKIGIALVDRPPMDPLVFTPLSERSTKAFFLLNTICPGGKWEIAEGTVIFLVGNSKELAARVLVTGKSGYTEDRLSDMENSLRSVYDGEGVRIVDTRGMSIAQVTRRVSEIIHFEEYKPFKFVERLNAIK